MASAWLVFVFLLNQTSCAVRSYNPNLQPSPELGNWSNILELKSGDQIIVKLRDGSEMKCRLNNATPDFISVALAEEERQIEKGQVVRVDKLVDDRLLDGALIGTALGFLAGFLAEGLKWPTRNTAGPSHDQQRWTVYRIRVGARRKGHGPALRPAHRPFSAAAWT